MLSGVAAAAQLAENRLNGGDEVGGSHVVPCADTNRGGIDVVGCR